MAVIGSRFSRHAASLWNLCCRSRASENECGAKWSLIIGCRRRCAPGESFYEILQGGGVKHLGILKPWSPTRSFGLLARLDRRFSPDGAPEPGRRRTHGVTCPSNREQGLRCGQGRQRHRCIRRAATAGMLAEMVPMIEMPQCDKGISRRSCDQECRSSRSNKGEVHAILGENGAGKSTLTKIMAGVIATSSEILLLDGKGVDVRNACGRLGAWRRDGVPGNEPDSLLTVAQNLYLGDGSPSTACAAFTSPPSNFFSPSISASILRQRVKSAGASKEADGGDRARSAPQGAVIIFDEPTASLTPEEKQHFFSLVERLKSRGVSIIFISHALEEALAIADRITVLRDGEHVVTDVGQASTGHGHPLMVGRALRRTLQPNTRRHFPPAGRKVLSVQNCPWVRPSKTIRFRSLRARSPAYLACRLRPD